MRQGQRKTVFRRPFVKRFALCYRSVVCLSVCLSVCPVCNVGVLWPNGWTDPEETWRAGRPRPWPHCIRWGPSSPSPKGHSHPFLVHICCGRMARWIQMPLGTEVGLGPDHIVLDGAHPPKNKGGERGTAPNFRPISIVAKRSPISATAERLFFSGDDRPRPLSSPPHF